VRIGGDDCYLRIERDDPTDWYAPLRLEARLRAPGQAQFFGWSDVVTISTGDAELEAFRKFTERRSASVTFPISDDGSIELRRDEDGSILVVFSIGCRRAAPHWKLSGSATVATEAMDQFFLDFQEIIFGTRAP